MAAPLTRRNPPVPDRVPDSRTAAARRRTAAALGRALLLFFSLAPRAAAQSFPEVPLESVHFEINYVTVFGDSVFVLGDIPELGDGDVRYAPKLVPGEYQPGSLPWTLDVAIPQGQPFSYRFVLRDDDVDRYRDPANVRGLSGTMTDQTSPPDPLSRHWVVYDIGSPATTVTFHTSLGDESVPLKPVPGIPGLRAAVLPNQPFGRGLSAQIGGTAIQTPRHAILHQAGYLYDYIPSGALSQAGRKELFAVPSQYISATRTVDNVTGRGVQIWLPRGYDEQPARRYPVLYMHDGQNVFIPGGPFGTWAAEQVAATVVAQGQVRELLIVAIDNSPQRLEEYNPDWPASLNDPYNRFLVEELKPYVDAHYRTRPDHDDTGVLGSSFGGIASLSAALEFPTVYGRVGAMSTSFWATAIDDRLAAGELGLATRVYLDVGDTGDDGDLTVAARDALLLTGRALERDLFFQVGFFQQHNEAAWHERLDEALLALFPIAERANELEDAPLPYPGDLDADCDVDLGDLSALLVHFGACLGDGGYDEAADLDRSGCVDLFDLSSLLVDFGADCSATP